MSRWATQRSTTRGYGPGLTPPARPRGRQQVFVWLDPVFLQVDDCFWSPLLFGAPRWLSVEPCEPWMTVHSVVPLKNEHSVLFVAPAPLTDARANATVNDTAARSTR